MEKKVLMLDCTLRDGGYVNDWDFGHSTITGIYKRLEAAGADYIEVGFLDDRREFDINRSIMPSTEAINKIFGLTREMVTGTIMNRGIPGWHTEVRMMKIINLYGCTITVRSTI